MARAPGGRNDGPWSSAQPLGKHVVGFLPDPPGLQLFSRIDRANKASKKKAAKENIFNVVENLRTGNPLKGAHVLDLFCGTGAMGLEALSRGADFCHFIDNSREAKRLTLKNVRKVGAEQNSM